MSVKREPFAPELYEDVFSSFHSLHYQRHNQRRLEHLTSLSLPLAGRGVLEVGAGIGDHSSYFLDRHCSLTITEGRQRNVDIIRWRYPDLNCRLLNLDQPDPTFTEQFDIVYCYGLLYHLAHPVEALEYLADRCRSMLLLETCVHLGCEDTIHFHAEPAEAVENSVSGRGSRPSRQWVFRELRERFARVYLPTTQPWHEEFPVDWSVEPPNPFLVRAVFVASREAIDNPLLVEHIPDHQERSP